MSIPFSLFRLRFGAVLIFFIMFGLLLIPAIGQKAIDFTLKDLDGNTVRLSDYFEKKVILLDFWATWCVPCVKELPHFQDFYDKYRKEGLIVLAITVDGPETIALVRPFIERYNYDFPVLLDTESKVIALYNPRVILPYTILIDRSGTIRHVHQGYSPGDEQKLEEEIIELLQPEEEIKAKKYAFYVNEAFLNRNFSDDDYVERERSGRSSQVISQLDLSFAAGSYLAGVRLDANLDFSPLEDNYSLEKRFFEFDKKNFNLRAGDFYYSIGRGLVLSILKTFEKEGLEYIIDTTVDGGKVALSHKQLSAEVFGGWLDREESDLKDKVYGGSFSLKFSDLTSVRFNFLGSNLEVGSNFGNKDVAMESFSLDIPSLAKKAKFHGEFLLIQKSKYFSEERISGHGVYLESGIFLGDISILLEFKDYESLDFEYNRPPLLESEQLPVLANQFARDSRNITGVSGRLDYSLPKIDALVFCKLSYLRDNPENNLRNITHLFAGFEKKFKKTGWLNLLAGYRKEDTSSLVFYYTHGRTFHYQFNLSYPFNSRISLEADLKGKEFQGEHFDYYERRSFLSLHYSPRLVLTLFFDQTTDPEILFFKDEENWWGGQVEVRFSRANSIKIFYGSNKGGIKCSGGVCKFFPPFEGLRIDALLRF